MRLLIATFMVVFVVWKLFGQDGDSSKSYGSSTEGIVMYSLTTCGVCDKKRRELKQQGIRFTERFLDKEAGLEQELVDKMQRAGIPPRAIGTPVLDVGGIILPDNPSMDAIRAAQEKSGLL
jgi:glutaredoxin